MQQLHRKKFLREERNIKNRQVSCVEKSVYEEGRHTVSTPELLDDSYINRRIYFGISKSDLMATYL